MFDPRAVRQALKALGSEPAPVPVDGPERVVLAGGGNQVAMSLYRALGRGTSDLAEAQVYEHQVAMLAQFEREAAEVLRVLNAFRTVVQLDSRRSLPQPATIRHAAVNGGEPLAVEPGRTYRVVTADDLRRAQHQPIAAEWRASEAENDAGSGASATYPVRDRVAPDMETCTDCGALVSWDASLGCYVHVDNVAFHAYGLDGHVVHGDKLFKRQDDYTITDNAPFVRQEYEGDWPVQEGPAMEDDPAAIVRRVIEEKVKPEIEASRKRLADSGIDEETLDDDTDSFLALPPVDRGWWSERVERVKGWLDRYTTRTMDELEGSRRG